jgi:hypothetical protein
LLGGSGFGLVHAYEVSAEDDRRDDEAAILKALFRYGVIAPLVERQEFARGEKTQLVEELAARLHYQPGVGPPNKPGWQEHGTSFGQCGSPR